MASQVTMPKLGLTMKQGTVGKWYKNEGDPVQEGEPIVDITTDKITTKVEAPASGVLRKILVNKGSKVPVGALLGIIAEPDEDIAALLTEAEAPAENTKVSAKDDKVPVEVKGAKAEPGKRIIASPVARRLAGEHGIDLSGVPGTGPEGRITKEDVEKVIEQIKNGGSYQVTPIEGIRAVIAERMSNSRKQAAHVTIMEEVDVTALRDVRGQLNARDTTGKKKITYTDLIVKFVCKALAEYPMVNTRSSEDEIELPGGINIGVAVALENGLVVPNIKNAQVLSLEQISTRIKDLAARARNNELDLEDLENGTFTISNLGMFGAEGFTPIINRPESAILGVGTIRTKPALVGGRLEKRELMTLSLSFDHRILDGSLATEFLSRVKEMMEDPYPWFELQPKSKGDIIIDAGGHRTPQQIRSAYQQGINKLMETSPDIIMGFSALTEGIFFEDGAVSTLNKELIAVALSVYIKCEYCIAAHVHKAFKLGATAEQVLEAANVSVFFGGGAALAHVSTIVQDCIEAFGGE